MRFSALLLLMAAVPAQTVLVYDNGPFVTTLTGGPGGAPASELQTLAPYNLNVLGFNANNAANVRQTDDFTVNAVMLIDEVEVFMYNTNSTVPSCTGVFLSLFDGNPATGTPNQLIAGAGATINLIGAPGFTVNNTLTGSFRVSSTTLTSSTARNIQSVRVTLPTTLVLNPGTYFIQYSFTGTTTPFFPPLTTLNLMNTGNAQQYTAGVYAPLNQTSNIAPNPQVVGATQGIPFRFYGPAGAAAPGAITSLGGGCSTLSLAVKGAPTVGGHLRADLSNVNPLMLGLIIIGVADPNSPALVCPCTFHASLDAITVGNSVELQVPLTASLVGVSLFCQGGQLDVVPIGGTACNLFGLQFELSDGFEFRLNTN